MTKILKGKILVAIVSMLPALMSAQKAVAEPDIVVSGLFKNRALLTVNGKQRLLKVGETSPEGVELLASDSRQAEIRIEGVRHIVTMSQHIASTFKSAEFAEVRIPRGQDGHYQTTGFINGRSVEFMIDTGASAVALNINDAERLGIDFRAGQIGQASTAGGIVNTFQLLLPKVSVGNITVNQVQATVVVGNFPTKILLGNSFLGRVEMREEAGVLVLRSKL